MKKKLIKKLVSVLVASFIFLNSFGFSYVAFGVTEFFSYENCVSGMSSIIQAREQTFLQYLEDHFESNKQDSALVDAAVDAYREYRKELWSELGKFKQGNASNQEQLDTLDACVRLVENSILKAKDILKMRASTSMRFKNTSILLEKYKTINSKLAELNFLIAKIVAAFGTFNNKMPCFVKNCLTK